MTQIDGYIIGVDLGGTIARVGAFTESGERLVVEQVEIEARKGSKAGLKRIAELVNQIIKKTSKDQGGKGLHHLLRGIGIGSTGPLDPFRGLLLNPATLPNWENVPIVSWMEERFGVPCCIENDADVAALGEYWMGAGQGVSRLYAITVGTGIGTACVVDGQVYRGAGGFHPEGGHQIIDPSGPSCYCGGKGCWESLASGTSIAQRAREIIHRMETARTQPTASFRAADTPLGSKLMEMAGNDANRIDALLVAEAARQGDPLSRQIINQAAGHFAQGVFNILMLFFPEVIVLSGGVMQSLDLFMPAIQQAVESSQPYLPSSQVHILPAQLGYYAGMYGGAYAILQKLGKSE